MTTSGGSVVLIVVDQHHFRRTAVMTLLESWAAEHGCAVIGVEAADSLAVAEHPDCEMVVLSVGAAFEDPSWGALIRMLHGLDPHRPIVVLCDTEIPKHILRAFEAGASGYLPTGLSPGVVFAALRFVLEGGTYVPPSILNMGRTAIGPPSGSRPEDGDGVRRDAAEHRPDGSVLAGSPDGDDGAYEPDVGEALTPRQRLVLDGLGHGKSNKQIARDLDMSEATVKVHVREVLRRLGVANRTQAALMASNALPPADPASGPSPASNDEGPSASAVDHGSGHGMNGSTPRSVSRRPAADGSLPYNSD